ncbi:MAG: AraC family transcriptional regulator [Lachnospiraceae bacterium]|nr:AraC family transcriptional regulator [Lachnospiraceae bacterium]
MTGKKSIPFIKGKKRITMLQKMGIICSIASILCISISLLFYNIYGNSLENELISSSANALDKTDMMISKTFTQIEGLAYQQALVTARLINKKDTDISHDYYRLQQLTDSLINIKTANSYIHSVYIYFNSGNIIVTSSIGTTSFSLFYDTEWLDIYSKNSSEAIWLNSRKPYNTQYAISQEMLEKYPNDSENVLTLLLPLSESLRNKGGVIVINVYEEEIAKLLNEASNNEEMFIVDNSGQIIVSGNESDIYTYLPSSFFSQVSDPDNHEGFFKYDNTDNEEYICTYMRSRFNNNFIIETLPLSERLKPTSALLEHIIIYTILFLLVSLSFVVLMVISAYRPIKQFYNELNKNLPTSVENKNPESIQKTILEIVQANKTLTKLWENNRMLIKHRTLTLLLQGKMAAYNNESKRLDYLEIYFPYPYFACCVLHLDMEQQSSIILDEQYEIIKMQLFPMIQQFFEHTLWGYTIDLDDLNVGIIINSNDNDPTFLLKFCERVQQEVANSNIITYTLSIGIGSIVSSLNNIVLSYRQACSAMRYAISNGSGDVINFSNISMSSTAFILDSFSEESEILDSVRIGDFATANKNLENWLMKLEATDLPFSAIKNSIYKEISHVLNFLYDMDIINQSSMNQLNEKLTQAPSMIEIKKICNQFLKNACLKIKNRQKNKNVEIIEKVISYMNQNYKQDISLSKMAEDVYMSVPYLSKIFKEHTSRTFTDYLTQIRIDASIDLLKHSNTKIKDIAIHVGYANTLSYIRAFKKLNKMTPSEFRETIIPQNLDTSD